MAESTLSLGYEGLWDAVGFFIGYGHDTVVAEVWQSWSSTQQAEIGRIVNAGLRQFYTAHDWSFLKPVTQLVLWASASGTIGLAYVGGTTLTDDTNSPFLPTMIGQTIVGVANSYTITGYTSATTVTVTPALLVGDVGAFTITSDGQFRMPDNFSGHIIGSMTYTTESQYPPLIKVGEGYVRERQQYNDDTGCPLYFAIRPVTIDPTVGQRWNFLPLPRPDGSYTLDYRYRLIPNELSATNTRPLGGMEHSETIKESCLAAAEQHLGDEAAIHTGKYAQLLAQSIQRDNQTSTPDFLGYNGDPSSAPRVVRRTYTVTYNGA